MKLFGVCINWKVAVALAAVAVGLFAFAPKLAATALPFLILAICPLSMLLMMGMMQRGPASQRHGNDTGTMREEQLARLKVQQKELARNIAALEREEQEARIRAAAPQVSKG